MATYKVTRNGRVYVYNYDRGKYGNNSVEYNRKYWEEHKDEIKKKAKIRRIDVKLNEFEQREKDAKRDKVPRTKNQNRI